MAKIDNIPFEEIGRNLNSSLSSVNGLVGGPDMKNAIKQLSATLTEARDLVAQANAGMTPMLQKLPAISEQLQQAVSRANAALGTGGYGQDSDVQRGLTRLLSQVSDTARSIRLLADFLDRHPESLIIGRPPRSGATER